MKKVSVIGGGLAGTECAFQLASLGWTVDLIEMRDGKLSTPAHITQDLGELVCSNSFGSQAETSASGQLKWEAQQMGSLVLSAAHSARVEAGQALAVDRKIFSNFLEHALTSNEKVQIHRRRITSLNDLEPTGPNHAVVLATGPLTDSDLAEELRALCGREFLYFFDAIAPIISADSIDRNVVWAQDRYDKGTPDYLNCPLEKPHYIQLIEEIKAARKITPHHFETTPYFEGCMPIEEMIERGPQTLRFGPMKPVGLTDPRTGRKPYAAVQLRKENADGTSYNMVGFQTRMAYSEQVRVLRLIPGLENAEFLKLGSIHRNLYVNSPACLNKDLSHKENPFLFFAGQISGVEGYFESACIGLLVAGFIDAKFRSLPTPLPPRTTALGALHNTITDEARISHFQPTNINFGLFPKLDEVIEEKDERKRRVIERARRSLLQWLRLADGSASEHAHI